MSTAKFQRKVYALDASGKILGRIATDIAMHLIGKTDPKYVPYLDHGDKVVIENAAKLKVTGKKEDGKKYFRFSGHPGGMKSATLGQLLDKKPDILLRKVVYNMLPKNRLRKNRMARLVIKP